MENKIFLRLTSILLGIVSFVIIFFVCYLLGWTLLEGYLKGNDIGFSLSVTDWVRKYLPFLPQWYPLAGGGVSLLQSTQIGAYIFSALFSKITFLSLGQSIRLIEFLSIFIVSIELYFYVWYLFKNKTTAFLTGIFFVISQAVWSLVVDIGMLPQVFSFVFIIPVFACYDLFLAKKKGYWLVFGALSFGLAVFTHLITGALLIEGLILYGILRGWLLSKNKAQIFENLFWAALCLILGFALVAFWFLPFMRYLLIASRNTVVALSFEQLNFVNLIHLIGLDKVIDPQPPNEMWEAFLPLPIIILFFAGLILSVIKKNTQIIIFGLLSIIFIIHSALPGLAPFLTKLVMVSFVTGTYGRAFLMAMILINILAAWACSTIASEMVSFFWRRNESRIKQMMTGLLTIIVAVGALVFLSRAPLYYHKPCYRGFGMGNTQEINYCQIWQKLGHIEAISKQGTPWDDLTSLLAEKVDSPASQRIDISPNLGPIIMNWPRFSSLPIVSLYSFTAGINNIFSGYFGGAFYGKKLDFGSPLEVASLASWFGIDRVILHSKIDPLERFTEDYWNQDVDLQNNDLLVLSFKNSPGLVTLSTKPKILILGKFENRAYEQFFRLANAGAYPYGKAMFIEGKDSGRIDDYTLDELKKFEMLLLYGYTYKDQKKAFELLEKYVNEGGRLFIETGWQYVSPNWQMNETPAILPVKKLIWEQYKSWDLEGFSPPDYQGKPWGVSTGQAVRNWAKPVLKSRGKILVAAGDYGQGKVVWSGMNLIGHAFMYKNKTEYILQESLIDSLLEGLGGEDKNSEISFKRLSPDKIEFTFKSPQAKASLYWRENYFPDWRAKLEPAVKNQEQKKELSIYRAGPNFMLIPLTKVGAKDKVVLELQKSKTYVVSQIISVLTLLLLFLVAVNDKIFLDLKGKLTSKIHSHVGGWWNKE